MKTILTVAVLLFGSACYAQEEGVSEWKIMPTISIAKHFPIGNRHAAYDIRPMVYPPVGGLPPQENDGLTATGISFSARFLNKDFEPFAFTLSAGANWYRNAERRSDFPIVAYGGTPMPNTDSLRFAAPNFYSSNMLGMESDHFMSFPIGLGAQIVFPYDKINKLMFYAGAEGNLNFLSRRVVGRHQVEAGFALVGGVAIKMVELGVRYSRFAGANYVGVQAGIRFNQFSVE